MIGGGNQLYQEVLGLVDHWIPEKAYRHERKFQSELQDYLDQELNAGGGGGMGVDPMMDAGDHAVSTERGTSKGDVVVDDLVGIELKRDLSNSQTKKLRGQIESYLDNYQYVIVCACGIKDMDGWRELKNKYEGGQGMGLGMGGGGGEVAFVHKEKENFGKDPRDVGGGGLFGGGGFF